jgi:hypothetical protein
MDAVRGLVRRILEYTGETLATVEGLEEEVQELQSQGDQLKSKELSLEDLESKFRKHAAMTLHGVSRKQE